MRKLIAKWPVACPICKAAINKGDTLMWSRQFGTEMCIKCFRSGEMSGMEKIYQKKLDKV